MHYQRNVKKHREWMIRAYILSYTIILMRPGISVYLMFAPDSTQNGEALAIVAPLMWILALLFLEVYIRRERSDQVNIEQHYVSIPSKASEEDGLIRIVNYQQNFVQVKLVQKQELNHNTSLFVFELPEKAELFTFPGHHVTLRHKESGVVCRHYSPITEFTRHFGRQGAMALAIKRYQEGPMSEWLHDKLEVGETVEMMGPSGTFYYAPNQYEAIGLIAGGTGITPFLTLIVSVLTNRADQTQIKLLYIASSARDFIFKQELEQLVQQFPNSFEVSFVADSGHIRNRSVLSEFLPKPSDSNLIALCGPIGFCTTVQKSLSQLKYKEHMVHTFGETD
jgi:cytochrome-b5 reductase